MKKFFVFSILLAIVALSCSQKTEGFHLKEGTPAYKLAKDLATKIPQLDPDKKTVVAKTNSFVITTDEIIQTFYNNLGNQVNQIKNLPEASLKSAIVQNAENLAEKKLLLQAAKKMNISATEQEIDSLLNLQYLRAGTKEKYEQFLQARGYTMEQVRKDIWEALTVQAYLDSVLTSATNVTEEDIQEAYNEDKTATVRHILLSTQGKSEEEKKEIRKKMEEILAKARAGEDFAKLAQQYSEDPGSKDKGGLYENFARGVMVKPFEEAAFNTPVGEISDIIETRYGYHILKVEGRQKETRPLEEVRGEIEKKLKNQKAQEAYQAHLEKLKKEAGFELIGL